MGKDIGVKTKSNQLPRRVFWNNTPKQEEPLEIKFHIQNIEYENEISEFTEDILLNMFSQYDGALPVIGHKYYHDEKISKYDNKEFIQYRVLVGIHLDHFYITYLIKLDDIYYKPSYEEEYVQQWIDLIYDNWTTPVQAGYLMSPELLSEKQRTSAHQNIAIMRKVTLKAPSRVVSVLSPDNKYYHETLGYNFSRNDGGCDCCKGARFECAEAVPNTIYVLNTGSNYLRTYTDCSIDVELLDYRKGFKLKCPNGEIHCVYETFNGKNIHDRTLYLKFNNNLIKMLEYGEACMFTPDGIKLEIKKGLSFDTNPYSHMNSYYPEWVNDTTLWAYRKYNLAYDRENHTDSSVYTNAVDLSNNAHIIRLYELYEEIEQIMDEYLQKGRIDYKNVLVKPNRIDPLRDLYEEFENFTNLEKIVKIKKEMLDFMNSINYEDIIPQKIDIVFVNGESDEVAAVNIIKSETMPNDVVLLINNISDNSINGKYRLVYNENNIPRGYSSSNKELLLQLYHKQYSARRLIEIDKPRYSIYNDIIHTPYDFNTHNQTAVEFITTNPTVKLHHIAASQSLRITPAMDSFINTLEENLNAQDTGN